MRIGTQSTQIPAWPVGPTLHHRSIKVSYECHRDPSLRIQLAQSPFPTQMARKSEASYLTVYFVGVVDSEEVHYQCDKRGPTTYETELTACGMKISSIIETKRELHAGTVRLNLRFPVMTEYS
jgi:hypothetical protein